MPAGFTQTAVHAGPDGAQLFLPNSLNVPASRLTITILQVIFTSPPMTPDAPF